MGSISVSPFVIFAVLDVSFAVNLCINCTFFRFIGRRTALCIRRTRTRTADADFVYSADSVYTCDDWYTYGNFCCFDCLLTVFDCFFTIGTLLVQSS